MERLEIKYRTWQKGVSPRPIRLQIPGWAGELNKHTDGDKPQPWHCPPFVDSSTYGLELCYPFETECHVQNVDGEIRFLGDFTAEQTRIPNVRMPPFMRFAPGHFGMTSALDIAVPRGYVLRTEPHPRFYTDTTHTVPCCLAGHIQSEFWPKVFFVVFKNPIPGQTLLFRRGDPYGQALVVPRRVNYDVREMTQAEAMERAMTDDKLVKYAKQICMNDWTDHVGHNFNDMYRVLSRVFAKQGTKGVKKFLDAIAGKTEARSKKFCPRGRD